MTRTDGERMAWCAECGCAITFYFDGKNKRGVEVCPGVVSVSRSIRSSKHALEALRRAIDAAMREEEATHD